MLQPPTTAAPALFAVFGFLGTPGPGHPFALPLGIGSMAFTPCPLAMGSAAHFMLTDNLGVPGCAAVVPSAPAPWVLRVPGGIPFPVTVTLQGVILAGPATLAVTNGVIVAIQ